MSGLVGDADGTVKVFIEEIIDTPEQQAAFAEEDAAIKALNKDMVATTGCEDDDEEDYVDEGGSAHSGATRRIQEVDLTSGGVVDRSKGVDRVSKSGAKRRDNRSKETSAYAACLSTAADAPFAPRGGMTFTPMGEERFLMLGGADRTGVHHPFASNVFRRGRWDCKAFGLPGKDDEIKLSGHAAVSCEEGVTVVFGGINVAEDGSAEFSGATWILSNDSGDWKKVGDDGKSNLQPSARNSHQMVLVGKKFLYLYGGADDKETKGDVWKFDVEARAWSEVKIFAAAGKGSGGGGGGPASREMHCCFAVADGFIVVGGRHTEDGRVLRDCWKFSVEKLAWTELAAPPSKRCCAAGGLLGGKIVIFGGFDGESEMFDNLMVFDVRNNTWETVEVEGAPVMR